MSENNAVATMEPETSAANGTVKRTPARKPIKAQKPKAPAKSGPATLTREQKELSLPQIRVLHVLAKTKGPLSRSAISNKCGNKTTVVVGRAVGYSDPKARAAFEQTKDGGFRKALLSLGYVREFPIDTDSGKEVVIELTAAGRKAYAKLGKVKLPELRD